MEHPSFQQIEKSIQNSPALEDLPDDRDFKFEDIVGGLPEIPPKSYSLREQQTPNKNQGARGTCTAHAAVAIAEFYNSKEYQEELDLSEEFLFKKIKQIDIEDYQYSGYGGYLRSAAKALVKYGVCREKTLPYNMNGDEDSWKSVAITREMEKEALNFKMKSYAKVEINIDAVKRAIAINKKPILMGMRLYSGYRDAITTGLIKRPKKDEIKIGGHAIECIGYNDHLELMEIKNSWGVWGDAGYLWIPYDYLEYMFSFWTFVDDTNDLRKYLLEKNRATIPPEWGHEAFEAFDLAVEKGLATPSTKPLDKMTKLEFFMFLKRNGDL